jgi:hypothetical protein
MASGNGNGARSGVLPLLNQTRRIGAAVAVIGAVALLIAGLAFGQWAQVLQSYLWAYLFWVCIALGCFALTLLHHVIRGSWALPVLRIWEAGSKTLPLMAVLFLPILLDVFFGHVLYHWTHADAVARDAMLREKTPYLNPVAFAIRAVIYFAIWIGVSSFLNRSSLQQDRTRDESLAARRTNVSAPAIVVFVISITFAFTDWAMSLDPHWHSTIFGIYFLVGQGLSALALCTLLVTLMAARRPYTEIVTPQLTRDLGNLLLAFTMLWAYISLSQFLIIWSGNLPEEVTFYTNRLKGGWWYMGTFLVVSQFFVPFLLLLSGRTKRTPGFLAGVAGFILAIRIVDIFWTIVPFFGGAGQPLPFRIHWLDFAAFAGMGGVWLAVWATQLRRSGLLPSHDPRLVIPSQEALEHA